ncbi:Hypothetical protein PHPALM_282 [Phytophthora palmivora]|uniref:Uncharacterized protein n=1 Tax=Phytophthora palmivora TaxID=4796 RepID=A0A2P4YV87_9STRA|nr:Hypothetical protein PHPALM_282 [Phytophthora palmivora]
MGTAEEINGHSGNSTPITKNVSGTTVAVNPPVGMEKGYNRTDLLGLCVSSSMLATRDESLDR